MVNFDGDKRSSIRTYGDHPNNKQGFKIGWDIDQSRKEDTKLAGKVGQQTTNSYVPAYQTHTYVPQQQEFKQDDEYLRQLYYQELNSKQQQAKVDSPPQPKYQDSLDMQYRQQQMNPQYDQYENQYEQPQSQMYGNHQNGYGNPQNGYENNDEELYQKYAQKMSNSGVKSNGINQQEDALSQFSQMHVNQPMHRQMAAKNKTSNIFNTDLVNNDDESLSRQSVRVGLRKKEFDDTHHKGYGNFYKAPPEPVQQQYKEQKFVNRNKVDNQIFPKY